MTNVNQTHYDDYVLGGAGNTEEFTFDTRVSMSTSPFIPNWTCPSHRERQQKMT